jgi:hypothetical protein
LAIRVIANPQKRGFGGLATLVAASALLALGPGGAAASTETVVGLSLARVSTDKEALAIRGASEGSQTARYSAVAALTRIPCPGTYRYSLHSENQDTGALSSYTATVDLVPLEPDPATSCGDIPPPRPGALRVSISGDEETIDFEQGRRRGSGGFFGVFTLGMQPECQQRFTIFVGADLRGWHRSVRYHFRVNEWEAKAQGRKLEGHHCG